MKIYTKRGDDGSTSLFGGTRVPKNTLRIECYGTVDEMNSALGGARAAGLAPEVDTVAAALQPLLFVLGGDLATPRDARAAVTRITAADTERLEHWIDAADATLPPLKAFILPGGTLGASFIHLARTVCRRAERATVALAATEEIGPEVVRFLNRLSDLFFVIARQENALKGVRETEWRG